MNVEAVVPRAGRERRRDLSGRTLAEGSIYELLRRDARVAFDPHIAHGGLIYDDDARAILASIHRAYLAIAEESRLPLLMLSDTWRASSANVAASRFRGRDVNRDNVRFIREIAAPASVPVTVAGTSGPRGDAYRPEEAPSYDEALRHHAPQIEALAEAADVLLAATLPAFEEARAIAHLMAQTRKPSILSFVVRSAGTLLDGTPLANAITAIDDASAPHGFAINCTHASVALAAALRLDPRTAARIVAFQGNTSALSPEELDGREELVTETPAEFADHVAALEQVLPLRIAGGCCGTTPDHIRALTL